MLIAQITDMHLGLTRQVGQVEIDPAARLARAVRHLNGLDPRPDFVICTGDLTERGEPDDYAELAALLAELAMPFALIPGNHDRREPLRAAFPALPWGDGADGLLCHEIDLGALRLIALDTLLPGEEGGELGAAQLAWLEGRLAQAGGERVLVAMHHPPIAVGIPAFDDMNCRDGEALGALLGRHAGIEAVICGHVHRAISLRWAGTALHVTPSTAYQYSLSMREGAGLRRVDETPACRLLTWLPGTGLVSHLSPIE